ncbi:DBH-like monooxygenase protein 1 homolog [Trichonephila inaurata madagascariensis]|uniref:DBH-like monooxygenase protein 1 homolog n=1 Tax=Trichonephila inaurata madagascariensis TaxID=2747483 RepID=A0A8X7CKD4_9ARAC|nr:DBH-like monooxygenase protein 1 homolog [Trichonephila inaurata madagascariensis]
MPEIDEIQNWNLVSGSENDTHSVLVFRRKLDTCDNDDRKIDDSTTRLIYAYSNEDPPSENGLKYHFKERGTKSVLLLQLKRSNQVKIDKSTLTYWDVLSPNFTIPSNSSTMYWCKIYKAPDLSEKNHVVLDLVLPEYVGLPLVPSPTKYYMMEIHYDNPHLIEGKS